MIKRYIYITFIMFVVGCAHNPPKPTHDYLRCRAKGNKQCSSVPSSMKDLKEICMDSSRRWCEGL